MTHVIVHHVNVFVGGAIESLNGSCSQAPALSLGHSRTADPQVSRG